MHFSKKALDIFSRKYYIIFYVIIKGWILEVEALVVPSDYTCFAQNGYSLLRIGNWHNPYILVGVGSN